MLLKFGTASKIVNFVSTRCKFKIVKFIYPCIRCYTVTPEDGKWQQIRTETIDAIRWQQITSDVNRAQVMEYEENCNIKTL